MKLEILINWFIFLTSVVFFTLAISELSANGYTFKRQIQERLATEGVILPVDGGYVHGRA